jgi:hypothetical protein
MEGWRVTANIFNKHSRVADKKWSSSLGVEPGADKSSPHNSACYKMSRRDLYYAPNIIRMIKSRMK